MPLGVNVGYLADHTLVDHFLRRGIERAVAPLETDLND